MKKLISVRQYFKVKEQNYNITYWKEEKKK